ncbi:MAG TPA: dienelactone hydrolase family protein [Thermomicrobiales bacterium]|nr:dienelactone hydrolase family protein [Thermomicrobiales bacterium]
MPATRGATAKGRMPLPHANADQPHANAAIFAAGAPLEQADAAVIAIHGRGASAADIVGLAAEVAPASAAIVAPQAAGATWYPFRFLEPIARNEPYLSSALALIDRLIGEIAAAGIDRKRIALLGFSQGACLALEYLARHAARYGAAIGFSGGLIGPPGTRFAYPGSLAGTPVLLGCSDVDPHIPLARVEETATVLRAMNADVTLRIYPGMGHTVNRDEIDLAQKMLAPLAGAAGAS